MLESSTKDQIDGLDQKILQELQENGRITNAELARRINLSPPAVHARIRRLEEAGYIRGYVALTDGEMLGYDMLCFVHILLAAHNSEQIETVRAALLGMPQVLECHHVTGEYDYILKVVARNRQALERFLVDQLTPVPGLTRIHTNLVLNTVKQTTCLPILP
ncbi:MAG: Lrp/AsnC family transcriptional regulator [Caldilineaceae bacterium]|nr:Lrp/AsnC family transcriptional regulator [Caldilineaceae bacterium]